MFHSPSALKTILSAFPLLPQLKAHTVDNLKTDNKNFNEILWYDTIRGQQNATRALALEATHYKRGNNQ